MTDEEVEDIIRSNMNMQMNLAGIRADFEEKLQRTWFGLTPQERDEINQQVYGAVPHHVAFHHAIEAALKAKNT